MYIHTCAHNGVINDEIIINFSQCGSQHITTIFITEGRLEKCQDDCWLAKNPRDSHRVPIPIVF